MIKAIALTAVALELKPIEAVNIKDFDASAMFTAMSMEPRAMKGNVRPKPKFIRGTNLKR